MLKNRREIQIEWGDCDPFGIVFFPRYFEYFDACTNALFHRALGYPKAEMLRRFGIAGIPLVEASCNFKIPSSFGDIVTVESCVIQWGTSSFSLSHKLHRGDALAVEGFEKRVWTVREAGDPSRVKSQPIQAGDGKVFLTENAAQPCPPFARKSELSGQDPRA